MKRIHAFEFNDMERCPRLIRDTIIEILGEGLRRAGVYDAAADLYWNFVERSGAEGVLDLGSGSGQPAGALVEACLNLGRKPSRVMLTDLFPNKEAFASISDQYPDIIDFDPNPVDATCIPEHHNYGACSIICAFHHFPPELAQAIITNQVKHNRALFILEALPREPLRVLPMLTTLAPAYFANAWRANHHRMRKFLMTYPIPIVALLGAWDGFISSLRCYDESEYRAMADRAGGHYTWEYQEIPFGMGNKATVFCGIPELTP